VLSCNCCVCGRGNTFYDNAYGSNLQRSIHHCAAPCGSWCDDDSESADQHAACHGWLTQRHELAEFRLAPLRVRPEENTEEDASTQRAPILQIEQQAPRQSQPQQEPEAQEAGSDDLEQLRMKLDMCNRQIAVSNATINQMETAIETLEQQNQEMRRKLDDIAAICS
jgi:hypothetical protein